MALRLGAFVRATVMTTGLAGSAFAAPPSEGAPVFDHVIVIVEENKDYNQILDPCAAPEIARLACTYGNATRFYGEIHPSEANHVALLGGDTFGIQDDAVWYCKPG